MEVELPEAEGLVPEKAAALRKVVIERRSVLVSGPAGCGKTFLVRKIVEALAARKIRFDLTATTGTAAVNMSFEGRSARTLHSFVGLGLAKEPLDVLIEKTEENPKLVERWRNLDVLVIDEISMIAPLFFETVDKLARVVRDRPEVPFGGLQLIMCGDFFQLPPVSDGVDQTVSAMRGYKPAKYAFDTEAWTDLKPVLVELTTPFRQTETGFVKLLNRVRWGILTDEDGKLLASKVGPMNDTSTDGIEPTLLYATNANVDRINACKLDELVLDGKVRKEFRATFGYEPSWLRPSARRLETLHSQLRRHCLAPETLQLAVGAQVMLLWNLDVEGGLCNGSRGVVSGFDDAQQPVVTFSGGRTLAVGRQRWRLRDDDEGAAYMEQTPLKLAYATTIHKSQGQSLDAVRVSLDGTVRTPGQAYVALSRARTLAGLRLEAFRSGAVRADEAVRTFYSRSGICPPSE